MGIDSLERLIDAKFQDALFPVDLVKVSKNEAEKSGRLKLVIDAEQCMDRLYGGYFSDWVCGGQWNRMTHFLTHLIEVCNRENIEVAVFFNGALEPEQISQWHKSLVPKKRGINGIFKHLYNKGTPPPKAWWTPPPFLSECLRYALLHLKVPVCVTTDDHHQEVIAYCRENDCHGLLAQDPTYIIFDPPRYFSSRFMKLTYHGVLETKEYSLDLVANGLEIPRSYLPLLAALLGNHILSEEDLDTFYSSLGLEKKENKEYDGNELIPAVVAFLTNQPSVQDIDALGSQIFKAAESPEKYIAKFKESVHYYLNGTKEGFLKYLPRKTAVARTSLTTTGDDDYMGGYTQDEQAENGKLDTIAAKVEGGPPQIAPELLHIASERHSKGLMSPWIYQVLTQGEIKLPLLIEDDSYYELPSSYVLYRPIRKLVYSILLDIRGELANNPEIKEWYIHRSQVSPKFETVTPRTLTWPCPPLRELWLSTNPEDKHKRLQAFLYCMSSDTPLMINTQYVQQHQLLMCCVLRYMVSFKDKLVIRKPELDAFLAQSVSPLLHDVNAVANIQLPMVHPRGVQLATLFMSGVQNAIFVNDVCGAPIPWSVCCPWLFFDGKLFHLKLLQALNGASLIDLCNGEVDLVMRVERLRQAVMEGLSWENRMFMPNAAQKADHVQPPQHPPGSLYATGMFPFMAHTDSSRGGAFGMRGRFGRGGRGRGGRGKGMRGRGTGRPAASGKSLSASGAGRGTSVDTE